MQGEDNGVMCNMLNGMLKMLNESGADIGKESFRIFEEAAKNLDYIMEGHGDRIKELACRLARDMGMTEDEIKDICLFAQYHDIGKVGICEEILFKPGKLSQREMDEMKRHSEIGYYIAKASPDIMHVSDWILKHHEWWNGSGYPLKLKESEIPVQCRILSIADAYDAMTNDRPYRKAMAKKEAIDEIRRFKGIQFDPYIADRFIMLLENS